LESTREYWFTSVLHLLRGYDPSPSWLAVWAPYLGYYGSHGLGILLAAALEKGGAEAEKVYAILLASANGDHEIGTMGNHVVEALLIADRPDGWAFLEKLLIAAQRQEGLRQVILERVDFAHPEAFRRMLRLIQAHDLVRFPAVTRAVDIWFGFQWDSADRKTIHAILADTTSLLENPAAQLAALRGEGPHQRYLALWTLAFENVPAAVEPALNMLQDPRVEMRFIGAHFLGQVDLPEAQEGLLFALNDESLQVVVTALLGLQFSSRQSFQSKGVFEQLERIWPQLPKKMNRQALVWPWMQVTIDRQQVAGMLIGALGRRSPLRLVPYLTDMDPHHRSTVVRLLADYKRQAPKVRQVLLGRVSDRSLYVRAQAIESLTKHAASKPLTHEEADQLEGLLHRKAHDLRQGVLGLLLTQKDPAVLSSATRLLGSAKLDQRTAGLELLRQLQETGRSRRRTTALIERVLNTSEVITQTERGHLSQLNQGNEPASLVDGLGLFKPSERTPPATPKKKQHLLERGNGKSLISSQTLELLRSLDVWASQHRNDPVSAV
jgi:hypothetical protein